MLGETNGDGRDGFTLVEAVVTAGILLLLTAVAFPAINRVRQIRGDLTCVSNLRQIGMGILAYGNDHNGMLPGPLYVGQYGWWGGSVNGGDYTQLASYIVGYLELDKTRRKLNRVDVFVCPANKWALNNDFGSTPVYRMNVHVRMADDSTLQAPFGYPNSLYPTLFGTRKDFPPMHSVALQNIVDESGAAARSSTWAMKDIDSEDVIFDSHTPEYGLPEKKVHHTHRNALFFDFHVERVDKTPRSSLSSR